MNTHDLRTIPAHAASGVLQQLGQTTRQLHGTPNPFGVMPRLQHSAQGLPEATSPGRPADARRCHVASSQRDMDELLAGPGSRGSAG